MNKFTITHHGRCTRSVSVLADDADDAVEKVYDLPTEAWDYDMDVEDTFVEEE